jgi:hypothetical protein
LIKALRLLTYYSLVDFGAALWASLAGYHPDCVATGFATRTSLAGDLEALSVWTACLEEIMVMRSTNRHCAYGQVASEGRDDLVGVGIFCLVGHAMAVKSRELFDAQTLERLAAAGVVSHCDGRGGGLEWRCVEVR